MLDLKKLLDGSLPFIDFSLTLAECEFIDESLQGTAEAFGRITNQSGLVLLSGEIKPSLTAVCGRCGKSFAYNASIPLNAKITEKLANDDEDEFIILTDSKLDEEELVRSTLTLELPSRFLCKEDCKGLCHVCGCDLNEKSCNCEVKDHDPRWDVLKDFFD